MSLLFDPFNCQLLYNKREKGQHADIYWRGFKGSEIEGETDPSNPITLFLPFFVCVCVCVCVQHGKKTNSLFGLHIPTSQEHIHWTLAKETPEPCEGLAAVGI